MSAEENKAFMRQYVEEVYNKGNLGFHPAHVTPGAGFHRPNHGVSVSPELASQGHTTIEDQVAEGDKLVTRYRLEGILTGSVETPWGTIAFHDRSLSLTWIAINRFENGKAAETWVEWDLLGLLLQLGATIAPPAVIVTAH